MPLITHEHLLVREKGPLTVQMFRSVKPEDVPGILHQYCESAERKMREAIGDTEYDSMLTGRPTSPVEAVRRYDNLFDAERAVALSEAYMVLASLNAGLAKQAQEASLQRTYDTSASSEMRKLADYWWKQAIGLVPGLEGTNTDQPETFQDVPGPIFSSVD